MRVNPEHEGGPDLARARLRLRPTSPGWLLSLAREVNGWYAAHRVLGQVSGVTAARLALIGASQVVLASGLRLLGVAAPDEM